VQQRVASAGVWALAISAFAPLAVEAQTSNRVAVGLTFSPKRSPDESSRGGTGVGFLWRLGRGSEGWGWTSGLGWYSADLDQTIGGRPEAFGSLRVRPILAGYGYSKFFGRTRVSAKLLGGYAFNSFALHSSFGDAYRQSFGVDAIAADVSNSLALKPELSAWVDLSDRVGLYMSAGYMITRPTVTVRTSIGQDRRRVHADMVMLKIGAAYSIF
jgi:hypothetical protein